MESIFRVEYRDIAYGASKIQTQFVSSRTQLVFIVNPLWTWILEYLGYQDGMWKFLTPTVVQLSLVHSLTHCVLLALKAYAGFWQYGTLQWDELHRYLIKFVVSAVPWRIFQYDLTQQQHGHGAPCPSSAQIVQTGHFILLSTENSSWYYFQFYFQLVNLFELA